MSELTTQPSPPEHEMLEPLPPIPEGCIRLYRGDVVDDEREPIIRHIEGRKTKQETEGRWFTDNPNYAEGFAGGRQLDLGEGHMRLRFVDVPEEVAEEFNTRNLPLEYMRDANGTGGDANEWLLPSDVIEGAHEYGFVETDQTYEPEIEQGLKDLLTSSELAEYLASMGVDDAAAEEIIADPVESAMVLHQLSMGFGHEHFHIADTEAMERTLRQLSLGVDSAHKKRHLGVHKPVQKPKETVVNKPIEVDEDLW